jgi:hypothetical protein
MSELLTDIELLMPVIERLFDLIKRLCDNKIEEFRKLA